MKDVSLRLDKGEILAIVGANGAGKSTLLRAIAGSHGAYDGHVMLNGAPLDHLKSHQRVRAGLALVPEGRRLFATMSVQENLALGAQVGRAGAWTPARVFEVFDNLVKRRHSRALNLSGGEQQATAIGRALVTNPDVILLDEVSLGLSPAVVDRVYSIMPALRETHTSVVIVEQDLGRAMAVADRVICMLEGRIVLEGRSADLTREDIIGAYFGLSGQQAQKEPVG
ncbi:ABC transporter ATP-binding protein [Sinisalibacter aestuarii]|uniref:ABC transporter ATP-binding protein n=1 Tax=Sinisalibacter aestuarii TaxID=2949426 RepID=A0ABQ5LZK4_9RHOB|nr:ABC transporter ATP-binding protein [Sinisalibacter aestuarii]